MHGKVVFFTDGASRRRVNPMFDHAVGRLGAVGNVNGDARHLE